MKTCHLHIGMHKTGSSSIQNYLDKNRDELLKSGFYYAEMGGANHSGPFLYCLRFEPARDTEIANLKIAPDELNSRIIFYKEKLADSLNKNYSDIIFSAESIVKLSPNELIDFKKNLLEYVDEIKVYCYVREPMSFTVSSFQQVIKTMPVFLDNQHLYPNYKDKLQKFEDIFGDVKYRLFSRGTLLEGDVTADFCSWLNLPYQGSEEANISLGALAVKFLYRFQHARSEIVVKQETLDLIENTLSKLPFQKVILPTKDMANIIQNNIADFKWMANHLSKKGLEINFNVDDTSNASYGNIYGVFSEHEKTTLIELANASSKFSEYVVTETGLSVAELVSAPLTSFSNLEFYIRKASNSVVQGWTCYSDNATKTVELTIFLNNIYKDTIQANMIRTDLIDGHGQGRYVGYMYDFKQELTSNDLVTIVVEDNIIYSGSI